MIEDIVVVYEVVEIFEYCCGFGVKGEEFGVWFYIVVLMLMERVRG